MSLKLLEAFEVQATDGFFGRTFMTTTRGYAVLAPGNVQEGDVICILFRGKVPYVLRPIERYHRFLGDCYVHSTMDGEAVDMLNEDRFGKTTFDIR
jgi:hypothetical protein